MSDTEQLGDTSQPNKPDRRPLLAIFGLAGCSLLVCVIIFIGAASLFLLRRSTDSAEQLTQTNVTIDEPASTSALEAEDSAPLSEQNSGAELTTNKQVVDAGASTATDDAPYLGPLSFSLSGTENTPPVEAPAAFRAGVTQIHAIFDYAGLQPNQLWTQVWYHNEVEISRVSQPWLEDEAGTYDYLISAGGNALPAGFWTVEFYVEDQLLTAGSFTIEAEAASAEAATETTPETARLFKLAYTKWDGDKHHLFVGDTNGGPEKYQLSRAAGPAWSQNGRYLFFYGEQGVDQQVVNGRVYPLPGATNGLIRMNVLPSSAGIQQVQLYQDHGWNDGTARSANISPDGSMIAFDGDRGGGRRIYFLGTESNQQFRIEIIGEQADWSPDSQRVVYRSGRNNQTGLWISSRDGTGHIRLTQGGSDSFPSWSSDGQSVAFSREEGGNVDIYTVNTDGSNLQRLTSTPGHDTLPLFLPNGDLVFRSARSGSWSIWKMKADGSEQVEIIANAPVGPDWAYSKMDVLR